MHNSFEKKVNSFNDIHSDDFVAARNLEVKAEIQNQTKEYLLGVDENEFQDFLYSKYELTPLFVDFESEQFDKPTTKKVRVEETFVRGAHEAEEYHFKIKYNFSGSSQLFTIKPHIFFHTAIPITFDYRLNTVFFDLKIQGQNASEFKSKKSAIRDKAFKNLDNANTFAIMYNKDLKNFIHHVFNYEKAKYVKENDFFAEIQLKVNNQSSDIFTVPILTKKTILQPSVDKNKQFSSEPTLAKDMYEDILDRIYVSGQGMERKPSLYLGKDEEALRDQFLFQLESRYDGITASGEAFNKAGKTDIILKYAHDGSNLFVAECKVWHGASEFHKAISQLFDNYLTWRDSKTALMLFVKNKEISSVLSTIEREAKNHPYYVRANGKRGESSYSYIFCLPQDSSKQVFLEIIVFHFIE